MNSVHGKYREIRIMLYRHKTPLVEAMEINAQNEFDVELWADGKVTASPVLEPSESNPEGKYWIVDTPDGFQMCYPGNFVYRTIDGEFWAAEKDVFLDLFEPVE